MAQHWEYGPKVCTSIGGRSVTEFDSFFSHYAERYMVSDVDAISAVYEAPLLAVREGRAIHLSDRTAVRDHLTELMAAYQKAGAARADIADINVMNLGKSSAMVTVHWGVIDAAGALMHDFHTTYQVLRVDGEWRILSYTNHD
jgi:SnoaL-like domain